MRRSNFTLWSKENEDSTCTTALKKIDKNCAEKREKSEFEILEEKEEGVEEDSCHSCGFATSYIFSKYDSFLQISMDDV